MFLIFAIPVHALFSAMLRAEGPSHVHNKTNKGTRSHAHSHVHPEGFQWAGSRQVRTPPTTEQVIAALRENSHGSRQLHIRWGQSDVQQSQTYGVSSLEAVHDESQRHYHVTSDVSVVPDSLDPSEPLRDASSSLGQVIAWAPPGASSSFAGAERLELPQPSAVGLWRSHISALPERPPRYET